MYYHVTGLHDYIHLFRQSIDLEAEVGFVLTWVVELVRGKHCYRK